MLVVCFEGFERSVEDEEILVNTGKIDAISEVV